jgi:hypothetical protein
MHKVRNDTLRSSSINMFKIKTNDIGMTCEVLPTIMYTLKARNKLYEKELYLYT